MAPVTKCDRSMVPDSCVATLRKHRAKQNEQRLRLGELWIDSGFVFTGQQGQSLHVNVLVTQFKRLIRQAGLNGLRFHALRHTSATLLLAQGVHPKIVQERLGHADIAMTLNRYSLELGVPIAFGVLTTESIEQAIERAGTKAGNKGVEAAMSAIEVVNLLDRIGSGFHIDESSQSSIPNA